MRLGRSLPLSRLDERLHPKKAHLKLLSIIDSLLLRTGMHRFSFLGNKKWLKAGFPEMDVGCQDSQNSVVVHHTET
jgi:hypothetical protein